MTINFSVHGSSSRREADLFADIIAKLFSRGKKNDIIYFVLLSLWSECMTETAFYNTPGMCSRFRCLDRGTLRCSMLSERYVPEVWGYLELPDGVARDRALGVHSRPGKASDIVLAGEDRAQPRRHPALRRGRVDALRARRRQGRLAERQGRHGRRRSAAAIRSSLAKWSCTFSRWTTRSAPPLQRKAPPDRAQKVQ